MGLGSGIRDPGSGKNLFRIPDPWVKKAPDPGTRIRICNTGWEKQEQNTGERETKKKREETEKQQNNIEEMEKQEQKIRTVEDMRETRTQQRTDGETRTEHT